MQQKTMKTSLCAILTNQYTIWEDSKKKSEIQTLQNFLFSGFQDRWTERSFKLFWVLKTWLFLGFAIFPTPISWAEAHLLETTKQLQKIWHLLLLPVWIEINC